MAEMDHTEIKRYLFMEMSETEREKFEEMMFADDGLFYNVADLENDQVDRYVRRELNARERARFEKALPKVPSRMQKIANAAALQDHIASAASVGEEVSGASFWDKIRAAFQMQSVGFAMGGLIVLLSFFAAALFLENRQNEAELARLQMQDISNSKVESKMQSELDAAKANENVLQRAIDEERGIAGDLTADLERERQRRKDLESEIAVLRKPADAQRQNDPLPASIETLKLELSRPANDLDRLDAGPAKRVSVLLALPADADADERFTVSLNGAIVAEGLAPRVDAAGGQNLAVTVNRSQLVEGKNKFEAKDRSGKKVSEYIFSAEK